MKIRYFIFLCIFTSGIYAGIFYIEEKQNDKLLKEQNKNINVLIQKEAPNDDSNNEYERLNLHSKAAALYDTKGKRILYGDNENTRMPMASTTKIMTCIIAIESGMLEEVVEFSKYAASMPNVALHANKGEKFVLKDLLYSLMLESHNDSAVAIAEHIAKEYIKNNKIKSKDLLSKEQKSSKELVNVYASIMNKKARDIGAYNTNFVTPNGLDADEHYTTAIDLAKIAAYAIKNDEFLKITNTKYYNISSTEGKNYDLNNRNMFLTMYDGAIGCKTGYTSKAGYCFVGAIDKLNYNLVSVVLASGWPPNKNYKWNDTRKLIDYGINNYKDKSFMVDNNTLDIKDIKIYNGEEDSVGIYINEKYTLLCNAKDKIKYEVILPKILMAPISKNKTVGVCNIYLNGEIYKKYSIKTLKAIGDTNLEYYLNKLYESFI